MSIKHFIAKSFFDFAYAIAYRPVNFPSDSNIPKGGAVPFTLLKPTLNCWYADPLIGMVGGKECLFMEVYDRKKKKGMIGVSEFQANGKLTGPKIILEEPFHLSFPVVFTYNNKIILMPECSASKTLRFYEISPDTFDVTLLKSFDVSKVLVDTVILINDNKKLVLLSCSEDAANPKKTSLAAFQINDLENGELEELTLPSEYTVSSYLLRNGGPVVRSENKTIRILQESTETEYGHNLILREIDNMDSLENYSERDLKKIYLEDLPLSLPKTFRKQGIHTYSLGQKYEVVDVSFNRFHLGNIFKQ